jgi:hypothetical protein
MPKQVLPTPEDFAQFEAAMKGIGFLAVTDQKFVDDFKRLGLRAPRRRRGREAGFYFPVNGFIVKVWTTWLRKEGEAREEDSGWVLIEKHGVAVYFRRPMRRTQNFLITLFDRARVTKERIEKVPHCQECNSLMEIANGRKLKDRYWRCELIGKHPSGKPCWRRWDVCLSPESRAIAEAWREEEARTDARAIARGKKPHQAMLDRKPWRQGQNRRTP